MPKHRSVPACATGSDRRSFYRFPQQDLERRRRRRRWLRALRRAGWTPSRHQDFCRRRRNPENPAAPSLFSKAEKRKASGGGAEEEDANTFGGEGEAAPERPMGTDWSSWTPEDGVSSPLTVIQLDGGGGGVEMVVMSSGGPEEVAGEIAAILSQSHVVGDAELDRIDIYVDGATCDELLPVATETQVVAYLETIPTAGRLAVASDTTLSTALGPGPISSTLPIVSKHAAQAPPPPKGRSQTEGGVAERPDRRLEEHCYHRSSRSREQLEAALTELQGKVKALQRRHRRHLEKLRGLEGTVGRLRHGQLLADERLQLLERAFVQTGAAADGEETVAVIYQSQEEPCFYAFLSGEEEEGGR